MNEIKNFTGLKLFPDEEILNVQRQHWIVVLMPLALIFLSVSAIITGVFLGFQYLNKREEAVIVVLVSSAIVSFLLTFSSSFFLRWYYQAYIITSKRLAHIHYFRMGGFHLDEVFHEHIIPLEIDRHPDNFFLSMLDIEDIYVHFKKLERPEPFVFSIPQDEEVIEDILEHHMLGKR